MPLCPLCLAPSEHCKMRKRGEEINVFKRLKWPGDAEGEGTAKDSGTSSRLSQQAALFRSASSKVEQHSASSRFYRASPISVTLPSIAINILTLGIFYFILLWPAHVKLIHSLLPIEPLFPSQTTVWYDFFLFTGY